MKFKSGADMILPDSRLLYIFFRYSLFYTNIASSSFLFPVCFTTSLFFPFHHTFPPSSAASIPKATAGRLSFALHTSSISTHFSSSSSSRVVSTVQSIVPNLQRSHLPPFPSHHLLKSVQMESRTSNLSAQMYRHGDYQLRLARSSAYVNAKVAANLSKNLQKCPKCLVLVDVRLHAKCPSDAIYQPYQWVLDPERWYL